MNTVSGAKTFIFLISLIAAVIIWKNSPQLDSLEGGPSWLAFLGLIEVCKFVCEIIFGLFALSSRQ